MPGIVEKEKDPEIVHLEEIGTLALLRDTNQILELQTILKDKWVSSSVRSHFVLVFLLFLYF